MNIVIYTANINNYDKVREPRCSDTNVKYILFTDNPNVKSNVWDVHYIGDYRNIDEDPQRVARFFKLNSESILPPHDISIWVDSKYEINIRDVERFIECNLSGDIACYKHSNGNRDCIYEEAKVCIENRLDDTMTIQKQMDKYHQISFPENYGLFDTAVIIRRNNETVKKFNEQWKFEVDSGSKRDQLSQVYVSWLLNIPIETIKFGGEIIYRSQFFIKHPHRIRR